MIITLDASAAVEVVMNRPHRQAIVSVIIKADWIIAPTLYMYEITNVMWKYNKLCNIPVNDLTRKAGYLLELVNEYIEARDIYEEALSLACDINHPTYDAMYLVAGRKNNASLLTLDSRLIEAAEKTAIPVVRIGQMQAE